MNAAVEAALRGRREAALLALPSVGRFADLLARRCREPSWARTAVATLDRFRALTGVPDLERLLAAGRRDPEVAAASLRRLAAALDGRAPEHVAALSFGAKVWWRLNGVPVAWRPLTRQRARAAPPPLRSGAGLPTLALIGSGLTAGELATVRVGDVGALDDGARILPDPEAEPLAVRFAAAADGREWLAFLSPAAREALLDRLAGLAAAGGHDASTLLVDPDDAAAASVRDAALISAGNDVNVALCRATGEFFRAWGMPGARFGLPRGGPGDPTTNAESPAESPAERRPR